MAFGKRIMKSQLETVLEERNVLCHHHHSQRLHKHHQLGQWSSDHSLRTELSSSMASCSAELDIG